MTRFIAIKVAERREHKSGIETPSDWAGIYGKNINPRSYNTGPVSIFDKLIEFCIKTPTRAFDIIATAHKTHAGIIL